MLASPGHIATWLIAISVMGGVIVRPWKLPEAVWAVLGAAALVAGALLPWRKAAGAVLEGTDVYLFLIGMMLLSEIARHEGLFDWLAATAVRHAHGSPRILFMLVYLVGTVVTVFLSNDATAVVLTPAVYAAARQADAKPLPYLFVCAFIANAASFVLPISNPANLVVYGAHLPSLGSWLVEFGLASVLSIVITFAILRFLLRSDLQREIARDVPRPRLSSGGRVAAAAIMLTALVLLLASGSGWQLGLPTCAAGVTATLVILMLRRLSPWSIARQMSWSVLPLVAGLFVLVEAVAATGLFEPVVALLQTRASTAPDFTALGGGLAAALLSNVVNNLPVGLIAASITHGVQTTPHLAGALLIGVDLGPNLSVTGSLATILWLVALRREGQEVSAWTFLKLGCVVMPLALLPALSSYVWLSVS